jgi:hypothetical protein
MKKIYILIVLVFIVFNLQSQDRLFLSTSQSLVYLKPSFCFIDPHFGTKIKIRYRDQLQLSSKYPIAKHVLENCATEVYLDPLRAGIELSYRRDAFAYSSWLKQTNRMTNFPQLGISWYRLEIVPTVQFKYRKKNVNLEKFHDGETARTEQKLCM